MNKEIIKKSKEAIKKYLAKNLSEFEYTDKKNNVLTGEAALEALGTDIEESKKDPTKVEEAVIRMLNGNISELGFTNENGDIFVGDAALIELSKGIPSKKNPVADKVVDTPPIQTPLNKPGHVDNYTPPFKTSPQPPLDRSSSDIESLRELGKKIPVTYTNADEQPTIATQPTSDKEALYKLKEIEGIWFEMKKAGIEEEFMYKLLPGSAGYEELKKDAEKYMKNLGFDIKFGEPKKSSDVEKTSSDKVSENVEVMEPKKSPELIKLEEGLETLTHYYPIAEQKFQEGKLIKYKGFEGQEALDKCKESIDRLEQYIEGFKARENLIGKPKKESKPILETITEKVEPKFTEIKKSVQDKAKKIYEPIGKVLSLPKVARRHINNGKTILKLLYSKGEASEKVLEIINKHRVEVKKPPDKKINIQDVEPGRIKK